MTLKGSPIQANAGLSPLQVAAKARYLDELMKALQSSGNKLTVFDFLSPAKREKHLHMLFAPSSWQGRVGEMIKEWDKVPENKKKDFDFKAQLDEAMWLSVHGPPKIDGTAMSKATRVPIPSSPVEQPIAGKK